MFHVIHKDTKEEYRVYAVSQSDEKRTVFLLYIQNEWLWVNAETFVPCIAW